MKLLHTELRRFWSRRLTWGLLAVCALLSVVGGVIAYTQTSDEEPDLSAIDGDRERCIEAELAYLDDFAPQNTNTDTLNGDGGGFLDGQPLPPPGISDAERRQFVADVYCNFVSQGSGDRRFFATTILADSFDSGFRDWSRDRPTVSTSPSFVDPGPAAAGQTLLRYPWQGLTGVVPVMGVFFMVIATVVGASFMGAEYRAGTVENLLLWEPRRARVMGAKFLSGGASVGVMAVIVFSVLSAVLFALASVHGSFAGIDARFFLDLTSVVARIALTSAAFLVMAMSISTVARTTGAAIFAILGWFVLSNVAIATFLRSFARWELFRNARAFISEGEVGRFVKTPYGFEETAAHGYLTGGLIVAVWAAILGAIATMVFVRRDLS